MMFTWHIEHMNVSLKCKQYKKTNIHYRSFQVSVGDVGAEQGVRVGANSDPRSEMRENIYWSL